VPDLADTFFLVNRIKEKLPQNVKAYGNQKDPQLLEKL